MAEKILLAGFDIEPAERTIVDNIIKNYNHKISERGNYDYIKLDLRKIQKTNKILYDVRGSLKAGKMLPKSQATDYNLFAALAEVLEHLLSEVIHKSRTSRQTR